VQEHIPARDQTIGTWLESLASSTPAPGGGAAAALNAAVGAALIEMACNLTIGRPRYAQHEAEMRAVLAEATELRNRAMRLAANDARAYGAVSQAHRLPKETDAQRHARTEQLQRALVAATEVPLETAIVASNVIQLAGRLVDRANINALADVAAATVSARAALEAALISVEANLGTISDHGRVREFTARMTAIWWLVREAERAVQSIRSKITPMDAR
jgi:formiminotetrahydrofolate cyclodeaminase